MPSYSVSVSVSNPMSLICAPMTCFYCQATSKGHITVRDMVGIMFCHEHMTAAIRDCKADLHEDRRVRLLDAQEHLVFQPFFEAVQGTFSIVRSSGALDSGWSIPTDSNAVGRLLTITNGGWTMPVEKAPEAISRNVSIKSFVDRGLVDEALYERMIATLDAGIYKSAADEKAAAAS